MGRIADLCGEVATDADQTPDGLVLPPETWERLRETGWSDEDIDDAIEIVRASFMQGELVDVADSLSSRLVELLGGFGDETAFRQAAAGRASLALNDIAQLARRVAHLEELLDLLRENDPVDRRAFQGLVRRLAEQRMEDEPADAGSSGNHEAS